MKTIKHESKLDLGKEILIRFTGKQSMKQLFVSRSKKAAKKTGKMKLDT